MAENDESGGKPRQLDLNQASWSELLRIPGIDQRLADAIVQSRPFAKLEHLRSLPGITDETLERLQAAGITVGAPGSTTSPEPAEAYSDESIFSRPVSDFARTAIDEETALLARHALPVAPTLNVVDAVELLTAGGYRMLRIDTDAHGVAGVVTTEDAQTVIDTGLANMCAPAALYRFVGHPVRKPPQKLRKRQNCKCSLIVFASDPESNSPIEKGEVEIIDWWTGAYGYSHVAIDCCEEDDDGNSVIIEAVRSGVQRSYLSSYGTRKFVRIPLEPYGVNCDDFCACVEKKIGWKYDFGEAVKGKKTDPSRQICSGLAFDCLPEALRQKILKWKEDAGQGAAPPGSKPGGPFVPHPRVSPNDLVHFFGGKKKEQSSSGELVTAPVTKSGNCSVVIKLLTVAVTGGDIGGKWTFDIGVQGNATKPLGGLTLTPGSSETINKVVFEGPIGTCNSDPEISIMVNVKSPGVVALFDAKGTNSTKVKAHCPGGPVISNDLKIDVTYDEVTEHFAFTFELMLSCVP